MKLNEYTTTIISATTITVKIRMVDEKSANQGWIFEFACSLLAINFVSKKVKTRRFGWFIDYFIEKSDMFSIQFLIWSWNFYSF